MLDPDAFAGYLLGALGTYTDAAGHDITLGELGIWTDATGADITLGELAQYLDDSVSLADVLLGLVPPSQFPYEDFPTSSLGLNKAGRYVVPPLPPSGPTGPTWRRASSPTSRRRSRESTGVEPSLPIDLEAVLPAGADLAEVRMGPRFGPFDLLTSGFDVSTTRRAGRACSCTWRRSPPAAPRWSRSTSPTASRWDRPAPPTGRSAPATARSSIGRDAPVLGPGRRGAQHAHGGDRPARVLFRQRTRPRCP